MGIQFDELNLYAEMAGDANGLKRAEVKEHAPRALEALRNFREASDADVHGFPKLPFDAGLAKDILNYAKDVRGSYDTVCLVGIGGSALGAWALDCGVRGPHPTQRPHSAASPRLVVLDNVDPTLVGAALEVMNPKRTLAVVVAKSGATAETVATFLIVRDWLERNLGPKASSRVVVVTSPQKGELATLAARQAYRTFPVPLNVGGRFSVLSAVGLVPAALIGLDIRRLLKGAAGMTGNAWDASLDNNLPLRSALLHYLIWRLKGKNIQVAFPYSNRLWGMAFWFRQLWAESLGKARTRSGELVNIGQTPIAALGTTDQHSQVQLYMEGPNDKVFTFWAVQKPAKAIRIPKRKQGLEAFDYLCGRSLAELLEAERVSTAAALSENGRPNCTFSLDRVDEEHLGAFLQLLEFQTAFMGEFLDINAFDQEGVELGKKFTFGLMGRPGYESYRDRFEAYEGRRKGAKP
jgi:glucose-6-phosphate isomerase